MDRFGIGVVSFGMGRSSIGGVTQYSVTSCCGMVTLHVISLVIVVWCVVSARFDKVWLSSE